MCTFEDGLCKDWLRSKATMKIVQKGFHLTKLLFFLVFNWIFNWKEL